MREASRAGSALVQRREEVARLEAKLPEEAWRVMLTRRGEAWTSRDLAAQMERWRLAARPLVFVLGGPHGLEEGFLRRAEQRWSLGPLTFPHELARVVVCEQLCRAFAILRGEPYHKGT